jgi:Ca2+-dependent lipid-binding protein
MDVGAGTTDPYVVAEFGNARLVTKHKEKTQDPVFYHRMLMPFSEPSVNNVLKIQVYDYDSKSKDDLIGTIYIPKKDFDNY